MNNQPTLDEISIRTELRPGDIGYVIYLHGRLYKLEYDYGIGFESYVAAGLHEFCQQYNPDRSRVWVCEHKGEIVGFLLLMDRGTTAQLRYFIIDPCYRGIGLGNRLMELYMDFLRGCGYPSSFLWTTHELHTAAHLYGKSGFILVEEKPDDSFGKSVIQRRYELIL